MPLGPSYEAWADNLDEIKAIFRKKRGVDPVPDLVEIPCTGHVPAVFGRIYSSIDPCHVSPIVGTIIKQEQMKNQEKESDSRVALSFCCLLTFFLFFIFLSFFYFFIFFKKRMGMKERKR